MEAEMQIMREDCRKRLYTTPLLTMHGRLEDLTMQTNKDWGGSDGITFQQQPVHWTS
jgi:hypothetical protein